MGSIEISRRSRHLERQTQARTERLDDLVAVV